MSSKQDDLPWPVGSTAYGTTPQGVAALAADVAASNPLRGSDSIGNVYVKQDEGTADDGFQPLRSECQRKLMAVRNVSGFAVVPKRLVKLEVSGVLAMKNISGYARLTDDQYVYPVDEKLPAAGCPDDDSCYIVIEGPALCYMPLSQVGDITDGQPMTALTAAATNDTTSGRIAGLDTANTDAALAKAINFIGWAMSAVSSSSTGGEILVNIRRHH